MRNKKALPATVFLFSTLIIITVLSFSMIKDPVEEKQQIKNVVSITDSKEERLGL